MPKIIEDPEQRILDAAEEIALNHSLDELNIRNIANKCQMAAGTIYNYYPNKECIIEKLMIRHWEAFFDITDQLALDNRDLLTKIKELYKHFDQYTADFHTTFFSKQSVTIKNTHSSNTLRNDYMKLLISKIAKVVEMSSDYSNSTIDSNVLAEFILSNFMALSMFHLYQYETFELAIKHIIGR